MASSFTPHQQQPYQSSRSSSAQHSASPPPPPSSHTTTQSHSPSPPRAQSHSTASLDSQTVILTSPASQQHPPQQHHQAAPSPEPRRCWICFSDDTEDSAHTSPWRTPCPCALTAHEACLLDWIADIESPDASRSTAQPAQIKCPQCKANIYLARPHSILVETYATLEKYLSKLLLPAFATSTIYTLMLVMSRHGELTIRTIFSPQEADAILATRSYSAMNWLEREALFRFPSVFGPFFRNWRGLRVELGLPLIPAAIISSRTTLADAVLPVLPIMFFATHPPSSQTLSIGYWPPSAALTLVALPYIRSAYDEYLERVWGQRERAWVKEVVPRLGEREPTDDGGPNQPDLDRNNAHGNGGGEDDDDDFEIDFEVELNLGGDDVDQDMNDHDEDGADVAAPPHGIPAAVADQQGWNGVQQADQDLADAVEGAVDAQANAQAHNDNQNNDNNNNNNNQQRERQGENRIDLIASAHSIGDTVFGALLFPSIASASGELLRLILPHSWTLPPGRAGWGPAMPTALLQTKWGRSIVGGCLFVALKDAVRIYCRWRMAVSFRARRIRNYDKRTGKLI